ncbi:MAG: hypothetical protein ABJA98_21435 [Acidobacteriota bacterium]
MIWNTSRKTSGGFRGWRTVAMLGLAGVLLAATGRTVSAQSGDDANREHEARKGIVGVWTVQVTVRNCDTNLPLGPATHSLVTFHEGGTLSESALAFAPGQRGAGHGTWTRHGKRTYAQDFVALLLFDTPANLPGTPTFDPSLPISPGFFAGWQTVTHTVTLNGTDHLTSAGTNAFYNINGDLYSTGCSTAVAQRFK